jgi:hypothetical protein
MARRLIARRALQSTTSRFQGKHQCALGVTHGLRFTDHEWSSGRTAVIYVNGKVSGDMAGNVLRSAAYAGQ